MSNAPTANGFPDKNIGSGGGFYIPRGLVVEAIVTAISGVAVALITVLGTYLSKKSATTALSEQLRILEKLPKDSLAHQNLEELIHGRVREMRSKIGLHRQYRQTAYIVFAAGGVALFVSTLDGVGGGQKFWDYCSVVLFGLGFISYILYTIGDVQTYRETGTLKTVEKTGQPSASGESAQAQLAPPPEPARPTETTARPEAEPGTAEGTTAAAGQ